MVRLAFYARQMKYRRRPYWLKSLSRSLEDMARRTTRQQVNDLATQVFGSRGAAQEWLQRPAMALEQRAPAKLLETAQGRQVVYTLLQQLEYGVYV